MAFNRTRGETIAFAVQNIDQVEVSRVKARIKRALGQVPTGEVVAEFTVTPVADLGGSLGPGWLLTLPADQSLLLEPGNYVFDTRVALPSGAVEISDLTLFTVLAGATERP